MDIIKLRYHGSRKVVTYKITEAWLKEDSGYCDEDYSRITSFSKNTQQLFTIISIKAMLKRHLKAKLKKEEKVERGMFLITLFSTPINLGRHA